MDTILTEQNTEINPLIIEIVKLAAQGLSDPQIARRLGKHINTIAKYRKLYGIQSGYKRQQAPKRKQKYHFKPLSQLQL